MYDIRQFRPTLYLLVILGLSGFALAAEEPGLWLFSMAVIAVNILLLRGGRFVALPQWIANVATIAAAVYISQRWLAGNALPILLIGQFLVIVQLIKLFDQHANRDYFWLLVMSVLLMVAAAINTYSLLFGVLLLTYLFLMLYCWLLFHLKVEADAARRAQTLPPEKLSAATLRQDQRYLPHSMRRLTWIVATAAMSMSVVVFIAFPRGAGAGLFGQMQFHSSEPLVGYSDQINFTSVARISQNDQVIARVWLWHHQQSVSGGTLLLRGTTLDHYQNREWSRSPMSYDTPHPRPNVTINLAGGLLVPTAQPAWQAHIMLEPIGQTTLFALAGPTLFRTDRDIRLHFWKRDQTLATAESPPSSPLVYDVWCTGEIGGWVNLPVNRGDINPEIAEFARRPEVCGRLNGKSLADLRDAASDRDKFQYDAQIADNIEHYLRNNYTYTLDLSDDRDLLLSKEKEPIVVFLNTIKKGHCEYFASAMALLCQSLGMNARVVTGFKCDDFNSAGGYFLVRQSHAHAWVEVQVEHGWNTYDPTSSTLAASNWAGIMQTLRHIYDYLQYSWNKSVIAYDASSRAGLMMATETKMTNWLYSVTYWAKRWQTKLENWASSHLPRWGAAVWRGIKIGAWLAVLGIAAWIIRRRWERRKMRKRARRVGLRNMPRSDQIRLARQLGFYDRMTTLLERRGIQRRDGQTPLEFGRSLDFLPGQAYDTVLRLTRVFYRIRFGQAQVEEGNQRRLESAVDELESLLQRSQFA